MQTGSVAAKRWTAVMDKDWLARAMPIVVQGKRENGDERSTVENGDWVANKYSDEVFGS